MTRPRMYGAALGMLCPSVLAHYYYGVDITVVNSVLFSWSCVVFYCVAYLFDALDTVPDEPVTPPKLS
jgi:hypothetical protein